MIAPETMPSLRGQAETILSEARAGQIVVFSIPTEKTWDCWRFSLLQALKDRLREEGTGETGVVFSASSGEDSPEEAISNCLGLPGWGQRDLLTCASSSTPLFVELFCYGRVPLPWRTFIEGAARFYRVGDIEYRPRVVCIFLIEPGELPPVRPNAGLRIYSFWNPLCWEEVRLLAGGAVPREDNPLVRAWRVSTYAGAAGSDLELLYSLLSTMPESLCVVREAVDATRNCGKENPPKWFEVERFHDETRWDVPAGLVDHWRSGALIGSTLDRGVALDWEKVPDSHFIPLLDRSIWREQVSGIFPLLMEISHFAAEAVTRTRGNGWRKYLQAREEGGISAEPKDILDIFQSNNLERLPHNIHQLLQKLRIARNKLAHLEPLDMREVQQIYSCFKLVDDRT